MKQIIKGRNWFAYCLALSVVVIVYGAIPFFSIPHLGSVVWQSGFAKSFVNAGWPAIRAVNIGIPGNAPAVFGLSVTFLQSTLMTFFNMHASDAYAMSAVLLLGLAVWGSIKLSQLLGVGFAESSFLSLAYLTLPFVWWHAGYGSLSLDFAFLPFYLYMGFKIVYGSSGEAGISRLWIFTAVSFAGISLFLVFNDGYTFVMFFVACGIIWVTAFFRKDISRRFLFMRTLPVILASALLSYLLYTLYIGVSEFPSSPMSFFRAWGLDIIMLLIPSQGGSWLWDTLNVSVARSGKMFFGDASVWMTTFALPLIITGGVGYWLSKTHRFALPLLLITLTGFYLSLGPSLKVNSVIPVDIKKEYLVQGIALMPEDAAVAPTGSAYLYEYLPGFKNMRAAYRWAGLMFTGLFGLTVLFYLKASSHGRKLLALSIVALLIVSNLPNIPQRLTQSQNYRIAMRKMDTDFAALSNYIGPNSAVFFAPPGNDIIVNYLASNGSFRAYNIGGDKNVGLARQNWPELIHAFQMNQPGRCFNYKISEALLQRTTDFIVIPYFDTLWGANSWPWPQIDVDAKREKFLSTVNYFESTPAFIVKKDNLYAVISLSPDVGIVPKENEIPLGLTELTIKSNCKTDSLLKNGWHEIGDKGVWSTEIATIEIFLPKDCQDKNSRCGLRMAFDVYSASQLFPKTVLVEVNGVQMAEWVVSSDEIQERIVPLLLNDSKMEVSVVIRVPNATSPAALGLSTDVRILGAGLRELELVKEK